MIPAVGLLLLIAASSVQAQRRGGGDGRAKNSDQALARREFDSVRGEFDAWKLAVLEGASLRALEGGIHERSAAQFYQALQTSAQVESLSEQDFRELGEEYIRLVGSAPKQGGAAFQKGMEDLREKFALSSGGVIDAATATLQVNQDQVQAQELLWFGVVTSKLSSGKRTTLERKQTALVALEEKAKSDKKVEEREREKLQGEAREILQEVMESIAS